MDKERRQGSECGININMKWVSCGGSSFLDHAIQSHGILMRPDDFWFANQLNSRKTGRGDKYLIGHRKCIRRERGHLFSIQIVCQSVQQQVMLRLDFIR